MTATKMTVFGHKIISGGAIYEDSHEVLYTLTWQEDEDYDFDIDIKQIFKDGYFKCFDERGDLIFIFANSISHITYEEVR